MYGKTSKSAHYLPRTGSYSTVPHRNGRVDVLPPGASDLTIEDYEERRERLKKLLAAEQVKMAELNALSASNQMRDLHRDYSVRVSHAKAHRSGFVYPARELEKHWGEKDVCKKQIRDLQRQLTDLNNAFVPGPRDIFRAKKASRQEITAHFNAQFVRIAEQVLTSDVFGRIKSLTLDSLAKEIEATQSAVSKEQQS